MSKLYFWLPFLALAFVVIWRLARREGTIPETVNPLPIVDDPTAEPYAIIRRVLGTEKLDRHELKIVLLLEVAPLTAPAYQTEAAWVIRTSRIAAIQLGQSVPVVLDAAGEGVAPAVSWAKQWHENYQPPPRADS